MSKKIHFLLLASSSLLCAGPLRDVEKNPMSLLPNGSVLKGVRIPRYDSESRLVGDLRCEIMTLIHSDQVQGEKVTIQFFHPNRSLRGKAYLNKALFNHKQSKLTSKEPLEITTDRLIAKGHGLTYSLEDGKGFLHGPASTRITAAPITTSMHHRPTSAAALIAFCLAPAPLIAAPPASLTEKEIAEIRASAASTQAHAKQLATETTKNLSKTLSTSEEVSATARNLAQSSGLDPNQLTPNIQPANSPLAITPKPGDSVITCDGGMYFDAQEGVLVYLNNVKVTDPRFTLSGVNELKVFFAKKPVIAGEKEVSAKGNFGDIEELIAEGAVLIDQKSIDGKDTIQASGRILKYNKSKGEIIIHGGFPWVKQGSYYARAKQSDLTLRLLESGAFSTEGSWEMGGSIKQPNN